MKWNTHKLLTVSSRHLRACHHTLEEKVQKMSFLYIYDRHSIKQPGNTNAHSMNQDFLYCCFMLTYTHTHTNPDMAKQDEECFVVAFPVVLHIYDYIYHCCREVNNLPVAAMEDGCRQETGGTIWVFFSWRQMQHHLSDVEWGFLTR